jgi:autophagy-related protein 9
LDEENLNHDFHDYDLENAEGLGVEDSRITVGGVSSPTPRSRGQPDGRLRKDGRRSAWTSQEDEGNNDVPASLLVECDDDLDGGQSKKKRGKQPAAPPGPSNARAQWETTQTQQRLHDDGVFGPSRRDNRLPNSVFAGMVSGNAKKKAEWRWANVSNLDNFIKEVYDYYVGNGMWCILVERGLHLV